MGRKESHRPSVLDVGSGRFRCAGLPEMSSPHARSEFDLAHAPLGGRADTKLKRFRCQAEKASGISAVCMSGLV